MFFYLLLALQGIFGFLLQWNLGLKITLRFLFVLLKKLQIYPVLPVDQHGQLYLC